MRDYRFGLLEYLEGGIDGSVFKVIEVIDGADRRWSDPCVFSYDPEHLIRTIDMMTNDLKNLRTPQGCIPDVTTTAYEWWWTDTPEVKYSTGVREDDEETERVCEGL